MAENEKKGETKIEIPEKLPVLVLRDIVIFPYMVVPLYVGRPKSRKAIDSALQSDRLILLITQKDGGVENPQPEDLYQFGTVAMVVRMLKLPDGRLRVLVQGIARAKVSAFIDSDKILEAQIIKLEDVEPEEKTIEDKALIKNVREKFEEASKLGKNFPPEISLIVENIDEMGKLADVVASNLDPSIENAERILEETDPRKRLSRVYELILKEIEMLNVQNQINQKAQGEMDKNQREYYLRQQLKAIKKELGEDTESQEDIETYYRKLEDAKIPEEAKAEVRKQIERLKKMHPESAESSVTRTYLDWIFDLPWQIYTNDNLNLKRAKKILDTDHYGLDKVKERILEYLSVRKLTSRAQGPILCFVGPPGVGKTSLGRSIARALNRKFVRISLGGVRDEAEIRGHRRTYVGALPGKIIQELKNAASSNPVFMIDEVDKIGADFRGDPSSALLEVLDPEQNSKFVDHYLAIPFDLSKVMFITTANLLEPIQPAFRDRMEVIEIPGYTEEEKIEIARRHLIPKQIELNGLSRKTVSFSHKALQNIIALYTREAGVRNLEREIGAICRKIAHQVALGNRKNFVITANNLHKYLGPPRIFRSDLLDRNEVGVATGMAWTPYGGDILFIEARLLKGKGNLILTGSLGDVMKESAAAALSLIKSNAEKLKIEQKSFEKNDIHIHIPEGGIPKDGPSAGITLTASMLSAFTEVKVKRDVAMTGEITLRGKVLPVGGIKEKILAARRAGIRKIILPRMNHKDLEEINPNFLKGVEFRFVDDFREAVNYALEKELFNG